MLKEEKVYILKNKKLKVEMIQLYHNILVTRHRERQTTIQLVMRNYWQLGVMKYIEKYVNRYNLYQRMKNQIVILVEKFMANKILEKLLIYLIVKFITKLPLVARKNAILVVCNRLFKITHFVVMTEETSVEELVRLFRNNVWKLHGLLKSVILDRKPQFVAELMKKLNKMLRIKMRLSIVFHPQIDKQIECMNYKLEQYLKFFVDQKNWSEQLVILEFAVNNKAYLVTRVPLFIASYGRELMIGIDIRKKRKMEKATKFVERMRKIQEEVEVVLKKVQEKIKK